MGPVEIIMNMAFSMIATGAFSLLFNIPRRHVLYCSLLGVVSWMIFVLLTPAANDVVATFAAACAVVLLSRILAIFRKCPVNVLLIPGIIPLVPGSAIYYSAYYFVTDDASSAASYGLLTLKLALAIVLGIIVISAVPFPRRKKQ